MRELVVGRRVVDIVSLGWRNQSRDIAALVAKFENVFNSIVVNNV